MLYDKSISLFEKQKIEGKQEKVEGKHNLEGIYLFDWFHVLVLDRSDCT